MSWHNPEAFFLFTPLLIALFFYLKISPRFRSRLIFPFDWSQGVQKNKILTPFRLQILLRVLALSSLIVALARPQQRHTTEKRIVEAIDMIIAFDLSKSMEALDFSPNRRKVAIDVVSEFILKRKDDRIGLVYFSGEAYLAVPLTSDLKILSNNLKMSSNTGLQDGTAIGQAIAVSTKHLMRSEAKSKVILLVTDGDNNMGSIDPLSATNIAVASNIKIYTIGIGKKGRVAYPITVDDGFGNRRQVLQYLTDAVNDELLQTIADRSGGRFYSATEQDILPKIFSEIDRLEKSQFEVFEQVKIKELADIWLWLGLFLLFLETFALQTLWRKFP
jgi:Ca-activated chloride channel family protein